LLWISQSEDGNAIDRVKAADYFRLLADWRGHQNVENIRGVYLGSTVGAGPADTRDFRDRAEWEQFWGTGDTGARRGRVRYQGGNLLARLATEPERLVPEDFRLRPDSAGYRAGDDGKDLGADIDLVGPGPAYERWQTTPAYQQWLKDTGQVKK
jgi:hypothetical protein